MSVETKFSFPLAFLTIVLSSAVVAMGIYDVYRDYFKSKQRVSPSEMSQLVRSLHGDYDPETHAQRRRYQHQRAASARDSELDNVLRFFSSMVP